MIPEPYRRPRRRRIPEDITAETHPGLAYFARPAQCRVCGRGRPAALCTCHGIPMCADCRGIHYDLQAAIRA